MGDDFTRETGLSARDPKTWREQIDFAMKKAKAGGWGPWHGAARAGIGRWQGIGGAAPGDAIVSGPPGSTDLTGRARHRFGNRGSTDAFVFHHTGGRGSPEGVVDTLNQRGLGVHYVMDRDGKVYQTLPDGAKGAHMLPSSRFPNAKDGSLSNANTMGMEVIAKDDRDVLPAQVEAAKKFMSELRKQHPGLKVYGHGEVNPGHKQLTEGLTIADAVRAMKDKPTVASPSRAETPIDWRKAHDTLKSIDFSSAKMTPRPLGSTPSENGGSTDNRRVNMHAPVSIKVDGAQDPQTTAAAVAARMEGVNRMSLRNAQTAMR